MAQTTIRYDNKDLEELRKFAKDNGLQLKRLMIATMRVGMLNEKKAMEQYKNYGKE